MATVATQFGEFIQAEIVNAGKGQFLVEKYVDGALRTAYPADSYGKAKLILSNIIA